MSNHVGGIVSGDSGRIAHCDAHQTGWISTSSPRFLTRVSRPAWRCPRWGVLEAASLHGIAKAVSLGGVEVDGHGVVTTALQRSRGDITQIGAGLAPARGSTLREDQYDPTPVRPRWVS